MIVGNRMTKEPITVGPDDLLIRASHKMQAGGFRRVPVVSEGKLVGIVTDRDIALRVTGSKRDPDKTKVQDIATPDPIRVLVDKNLQRRGNPWPACGCGGGRSS